MLKLQVKEGNYSYRFTYTPENSPQFFILSNNSEAQFEGKARITYSFSPVSGQTVINDTVEFKLWHNGRVIRDIKTYVEGNTLSEKFDIN